jgi:hypothetical protein
VTERKLDMDGPKWTCLLGMPWFGVRSGEMIMLSGSGFEKDFVA